MKRLLFFAIIILISRRVLSQMQNRQRLNIVKYQKYMRPSGCCQACLSQVQLAKDCIITCEICRSCIHQTHYGSELSQPTEIWQCERCRYFLENGPVDIACQFCPSLRGIMKQYLYENRKIWLHPECAVWGFPVIFFASSKKEGIRKEKPKSESTYFWIKDYEPNQYPCQVCKGLNGYLIKCKYYSCTKTYHATCARPYGIIRDLESMRIENGANYFPVYCKEHIELKIEDCKKRVKLYKERGEEEKANHFQKIGNLIVEQLKNLEAAVLKCKQEEEMIKKMSIETRRNMEGNEDVSLSELEESFSSQISNQLLKIIQEEMIDQSCPLQPIESIKVLKQEPQIKIAPPPAPPAPVIKPTISQLKINRSTRPIHHNSKNHPKNHHHNHHSHSNKQHHKPPISTPVQNSAMDIQPSVNLMHPRTDNNERSQSDKSGEGQHKVNSYEEMFDNF